MKPKIDGSSRRAIFISAIAFMGLAHILFLNQIVKGVLFAIVQIVILINIPWFVNNIQGLITLGESAPHLAVRYRPHSMNMMIDGVIAVVILLLFVCIFIISVRSALKSYREYCAQNGILHNATRNPFKTFTNSLNNSFPILALAPAVLLVVFLIVVPLVFATLVAFTNYSFPHNLPPANTVDWVGLENFRNMFSGQNLWSGALLRVTLWTLAWAFFATATCYFGGLFMAVIMREFKVKFAPVFRTIFILPYAVPAIISMIVWRNLLNGSFGAINRTLMHFGIIQEMVPWLTSLWLTRFTLVLVNLWAGFPYFMLLALGSMTAINEDLFDAARIDGANKFNVFRHITLPLVAFQTMPLIIMSFTHNINNFGAIFFLAGGFPTVLDTPLTSATGVDILISWIYRLTMESMRYNMASVLAVMIFVLLAPFAIFNFRRTKAFKEGEL